jgi:thioredoxin-like negative regulator of GroEL
MLERLALALVLLLVGFVAYRAFTAWQLRRASAQHRQIADPLLTDAPNVPTVLYFTTPTCAPCKTTQTPVLNQLKAELGERLHVVRVDAEADPEAAARWGVLTVPTVFVLDANGKPQRVFNGVVGAPALRQALQPLGNAAA